MEKFIHDRGGKRSFIGHHTNRRKREKHIDRIDILASKTFLLGAVTLLRGHHDQERGNMGVDSRVGRMFGHPFYLAVTQVFKNLGKSNAATKRSAFVVGIIPVRCTGRAFCYVVLGLKNG